MAGWGGQRLGAGRPAGTKNRKSKTPAKSKTDHDICAIISGELLSAPRIGRPKAYSDPDKFRAVCEACFQRCMDEDRPPTVAGLANALGMTIETLARYGEQEEFSWTVALAKQHILENKNVGMLTGKYKTAAAIFDLKNNHGWIERGQHEGVGELRVIIDLGRANELSPPIEGQVIRGEVIPPVED